MALATSLRRSGLTGGGRVFRMYPQVVFFESPQVNHMNDWSFSSGMYLSTWTRQSKQLWLQKTGRQNFVQSGWGNPPEEPFFEATDTCTKPEPQDTGRQMQGKFWGTLQEPFRRRSPLARKTSCQFVPKPLPWSQYCCYWWRMPIIEVIFMISLIITSRLMYHYHRCSVILLLNFVFQRAANGTESPTLWTGILRGSIDLHPPRGPLLSHTAAACTRDL